MLLRSAPLVLLLFSSPEVDQAKPGQHLKIGEEGGERGQKKVRK